MADRPTIASAGPTANPCSARPWQLAINTLISKSTKRTLEKIELSYATSGEQQIILTFRDAVHSSQANRLPDTSQSADLVNVTTSQLVLPNAIEVHLQSGIELPLADPSLSYHSADPRLWDYDQRYSVMCTSPLPFPHQFFYGFVDAVRFELMLRRDPLIYLNWKSTLSEWMNFVHSRAYMLLAGPEPVARIASRLLDGQAVEHALVPLPTLPGKQAEFVVDIGPHWFVLGSV